MAASTADLQTATTATIDYINVPVAASTVIYLNENVCANGSGYLVPASDTSGLIFLGYALQHVDNSGGSAGDLSCPVNLRGSGPDGRGYYFDCASATQAWVGAKVYFTDDHTVALSSGQSILAGRVIQFLSATKVLVDVTSQA